MIYGSDHAHWDWMTGDGNYSPIDWTRSQSVYAFLKACDGVRDTPHYADEIRAARTAGKLAAPYVWLYPSKNLDVKAQADFWYSRLKDEPLIVIDFESYSVFNPVASDLYGAIERLRENGYAGRIMIYTGHYYWTANGNNDSYWLQFPIWLARYSAYEPQPTAPWNHWDFWQFSASGDPSKYGITNGKLAVDENRFDGTMEELEQLFGGVPTPPQPGENDMYKGTCLINGLRVRDYPSTGAVINSLNLGDKVEADKVVNGWWHLTKIRGVVTAGENWSFEGETKGYIRTDEVINPPAGTLPVIHLRATGYPDTTWSPL